MDAPEVIMALSGRWFGTYGVARCPAHIDHQPSLSVTETEAGKLLVKCHAGCAQEMVINALRQLGLWVADLRPLLKEHKVSRRLPMDDEKRTMAALKIWHSASPAASTLSERYLISRKITLSPPPVLRFHRRLKHPIGEFLPAMVALVTNGIDGSPQAIHRTYLAIDGSGKALVDPQKAMLGPCRGGVVRLAEPSDVLMVGEGIESCLAAMQATGKPAWAALSTSGLRTLDLPGGVRNVIIIADGDHAGETAAARSARRWISEGRRVRIACPPTGMDFNDLLTHRAGGHT